MSVIKECPFCNGNRIGCDYCDESGLMDLNEIARAEQMNRVDDEEDD